MIRIGIVGCGRILAAHLRGDRRLREAGVDDFQITALCARKAEDALGYVKRGEGPPQRPAVSKIPGDPLAVGDEYLSDWQPEVEVAVYSDYEEMIAEGPVDAVNDFTIHRLHHTIACLAFAHGKHVMSQKPLAVSMEGARRMCEAAERAGVTFGVFEWVLMRGGSLEAARTAAVNMLVVGELVYLFNVRHFTASAFSREILTGNPVALWMSLVLVGFQLVFTYAPPMQQVFQTVALDAATWGVILALGAAKFLAVEAEKAVLRRLNIRSM